MNASLHSLAQLRPPLPCFLDQPRTPAHPTPRPTSATPPSHESDRTPKTPRPANPASPPRGSAMATPRTRPPHPDTPDTPPSGRSMSTACALAHTIVGPRYATPPADRPSP